MKLPPLPPVLCHTKDYDEQYTSEQMYEYGQACRDAVLAEIKAKIEDMKTANNH